MDVLDISPEEGKGGHATTPLMEGSLCPRHYAGNLKRVVSFPTSEMHCHILILQMKNLKVKEIKCLFQGPRAKKQHSQDFGVHIPNTAFYLFTCHAVHITIIIATHITLHTPCERRCRLYADFSFIPQQLYEWKILLLFHFACEANHLKSHSE